MVVVSFLVESIAIFEESVAILLVVSVDILAVVSVLVESALASELALLLQAAKAAIATTNKNFFI